MPRSRRRVCLESGLKLDLNELRRQALVIPGAKQWSVIRWTNTYTGEEIANGVLTSNMEGKYEGWLRIQLGSLDQTIILVPKPRHFGGYQWYFVCPVMNRYASVLWMPPGGPAFAAVRHGEGESPTHLNFWTQTTALIEVKPKSKLG
jgi:hypothetical protein